VVEQALSGGAAPPGPSPSFVRAAFEVGPSNQLAARAADAVAQEPGRRYNPLFIHGPSGVGKTHLVNAIGNELVAQDPAMVVAAVGAVTFVDELITALQTGNVERWRARYRRADVLVLDDVHFVAGKERTQDELFHVFNALHQTGKQIILASDRPPKELDGLEERLRSRFEGGLVVAIQAPDRQLRKRLYQRYFQQASVAADEELLNYLADRTATSVREIVGTVNRLVASAEVSAAAVTADLARAELDGVGAMPAPAPATMAAADPFFLDDEKVVWEWPDVGGRIIEDLR
jgi:chromosomal replication initiator protein